MPGLLACICGGPVPQDDPQPVLAHVNKRDAELQSNAANCGPISSPKQQVPPTTVTADELIRVHSPGGDALQKLESHQRQTESKSREALAQVALLLRSLTELRGPPVEQLQGACSILVDSLDCQFVSVSVVVDGPATICICAAGAESAAAALGVPKPIIPTATAADRVLCSKDGIMSILSPDLGQQTLASSQASVPAEWVSQSSQTGLEAFAAVPVSRGGKPVGVLTVASYSGQGWEETSMLGLLGVVSSWVSQLFDTPQMARLPSIILSTVSAESVEDLVGALAAGLQEHIRSFLQLKVNARVALLNGQASAVVFEQQVAGQQAARRSVDHSFESMTGSSANPELRAKLSAIRKSTAITSLQDFRSLATAITKNDEVHDLFQRESLNLGLSRGSFGGQISNSGNNAVYSAYGNHMGPSSGQRGSSSAARRNSSLRGDALASSVQSRLGGHKSGDMSEHKPIVQFAAGVNSPSLEDRLALGHKQRTSGMRRGSSTSLMGKAGPPQPAPFHVQRAATSSTLLDSHGALTEDVLLRMVHEFGDQATAPMQLVAFPMISLEKTLLQSVLAQDSNLRGTWIADIATFMMQPNRPGKDIVISTFSPSVASIAVACMPSIVLSLPPDAGRSTTTHSLPFQALGSMDLVPINDPMSTGGSVLQDQPMLAVYLTSATTLSALQLNDVLAELHRVLGLLSAPLTERLRGPLHSSFMKLLNSMLDEVEPVPMSPSYVQRAKTTPHSPQPCQRRLSHLNTANKTSRSLPGRAASVGPSSGLGSQDEATQSDNLLPYVINSVSKPLARVRSCLALYSREPLKAQVAPLVAGMQDRLRGLLRDGSEANTFNRYQDLSSVRAEGLIAHGGFGSVYQGLWHGLEVAIKVVPQRSDHTDSVREAVELAVMSTVSHPNILGVQNYWTDVLVTSTPMKRGEKRPNGLLRLDSPQTEAESELVIMSLSGSPRVGGAPGSEVSDKEGPARCLVIIMELCDQGSLDDAIQRGAFRYQSQGVARINMLAVLTTLLEIAMALRHMHHMQLVHCDLKPGNVLLKSSMTDVRRFTTKLCDFGLVKIRQEANDLTEVIRRATFTGTVTHSPPEMLKGDPNPNFSYDVYALGIIMWELTSSTPVYGGLTDREVAQQVVYRNLRPEFPRGFDPTYKDLASACWAADSVQRPTTDQVVHRIGAMLTSLRDSVASLQHNRPGSP